MEDLMEHPAKIRRVDKDTVEAELMYEEDGGVWICVTALFAL